MTSEQLKQFRLRAIQQGYSPQEIDTYLSSGDSYEDRKSLYQERQKVSAIKPTAEPKENRGLLQKTAGFLGVEKFGQGIASAARVATGAVNQTGNEEASALLQQSEIMKRYAPGSEERKRAMGQFNTVYKGGVPTQAEIDPGTQLSNREVIGSAANVALNVAAPNAFSGGAKAILAKNAALGTGFGVAGGLNDKKSGSDLIKSGITGGVIGGAIPVVGKIFSTTTQKVFPKIAQRLEQTNLRLTPVQKQNLGKKVNEVSEFLAKKSLVGNPETRYSKITKLYSETEKKLQSTLQTLKKGYKKEALITKLENLKSSPQYLDNRDYDLIQKQIDGAISLIQRNYPSVIPYARLNNLKRSTYESAYNRAGDKILDEVEHDIGDILRGAIETGTKGTKIDGKDISAFNREYGQIIQARKLLKIAQSRNQIGLVGKLVSALAGGLTGNSVAPVVGGVVGGAVGNALAEKVAGTATRSVIGTGLNKASKIGKGKIAKGIKAVTKRTILNSN